MQKVSAFSRENTFAFAVNRRLRQHVFSRAERAVKPPIVLAKSHTRHHVYIFLYFTLI